MKTKEEIWLLMNDRIEAIKESFQKIPGFAEKVAIAKASKSTNPLYEFSEFERMYARETLRTFAMNFIFECELINDINNITTRKYEIGELVDEFLYRLYAFWFDRVFEIWDLDQSVEEQLLYKFINKFNVELQNAN